MSTQTTATATRNHTLEIADAVHGVASRLRDATFPIVGIQASWSHVREMPVVHIHTAKWTQALAAYFNLRTLTETEETAMYEAARVVGLPGILVGVYGPTERS